VGHLVGRVGRVKFGERHDKQTNQQQTAGRPIMSAHGNDVIVYVKEWLRRVHVYKFFYGVSSYLRRSQRVSTLE